MTDDRYADLLSKSTRLMIAACGIAAVNVQLLASNKRIVTRWAAELASNLVDRYVWIKTAPPPQIAANVATSKFEDIYVFSIEKDPGRAISTANFHGTVTNVHEGPGVRGNAYADIHNATMPIHLAEWMLAVFAEKADYVVDPFGGTGTTLMVAEQLGKRCALVELDPAYCDVVVERWQNFTGRTATRSKS